MKTEKMLKETTVWDMAEHINTKEDVLAYLETALEENDTALLLDVIGHIARSKGMTHIAEELNMSRKGLYKALAPDGNPSFKTVFKLIDLLGLRIKVEQKRAGTKKRMKKVPASWPMC